MVFSLKKLYLFLLLVFIYFTEIKAQRIEINSWQLNAGLGISEFAVPVYVSLDYGIFKHITIGGDISYRRYSSNYSKLDLIGLGSNLNFHSNSIIKSTKLDLYIGPSATYYIWLWDKSYNGDKLSNIGFAGNIGGRYFFSDNLAINTELNLGFISGIKLGISARL
jgi:outer membrane immunogenic protein